MDSEHELAEHVNCYDEAINNCEMEESPELTEMGTTDDMTVPATTCYEKDVDIEELFCDTTELSNHGKTEVTVKDAMDKADLKDIWEMPIGKMKELVARLDIDIVELKREWKKEMRKMLALILETLQHDKSLFDEAETIAWDISNLPDQIGILKKSMLDEKFESWEKVWIPLDNKNKWEDYYKLLRECWKDFEEEDFKIIDECKGLGAQMETQRTRMLETVTEYLKRTRKNILGEQE